MIISRQRAFSGVPSRREAALSRASVAIRLGVDDECAIKALVNVALQRNRMAVIEMTTEWLRIEFICELLARLHQAGARHTVHAPGVDAVKMHGMRLGT